MWDPDGDLGRVGDIRNQLPHLAKVLLRFRESHRICSTVGAVTEKTKPEKSRFGGKVDPWDEATGKH